MQEVWRAVDRPVRSRPGRHVPSRLFPLQGKPLSYFSLLDVPQHVDTNQTRTVVRLLRRNSSRPTTATAALNTLSAKPTTSAASASSAIIVAALCGDPISQHLIGNITSIISLVHSAQLSSAPRTAITNTTATSTATIIIRLSSHNDATAVKPPFLSSLSRSSATAKTSTGTQSAT